MELALGKHSHRSDAKPVELQQTKDLVGFLGPGVEVEGQIKVSGGTFQFNSQFQGNILSQETIIIGEQAKIESDIEARVVRVTGRVKGSIRATEALEIKEHGVVLGDITTPVLLIEPGGYFDGQCHMPTPEPPKESSDF